MYNSPHVHANPFQRQPIASTSAAPPNVSRTSWFGCEWTDGDIAPVSPEQLANAANAAHAALAQTSPPAPHAHRPRVDTQQSQRSSGSKKFFYISTEEHGAVRSPHVYRPTHRPPPLQSFLPHEQQRPDYGHTSQEYFGHPSQGYPQAPAHEYGQHPQTNVFQRPEGYTYQWGPSSTPWVQLPDPAQGYSSVHPSVWTDPTAPQAQAPGPFTYFPPAGPPPNFPQKQPPCGPLEAPLPGPFHARDDSSELLPDYASQLGSNPHSQHTGSPHRAADAQSDPHLHLSAEAQYATQHSYHGDDAASLPSARTLRDPESFHPRRPAPRVPSSPSVHNISLPTVSTMNTPDTPSGRASSTSPGDAGRPHLCMCADPSAPAHALHQLPPGWVAEFTAREEEGVQYPLNVRADVISAHISSVADNVTTDQEEKSFETLEEGLAAVMAEEASGGRTTPTQERAEWDRLQRDLQRDPSRRIREVTVESASENGDEGDSGRPSPVDSLLLQTTPEVRHTSSPSSSHERMRLSTAASIPVTDVLYPSSPPDRDATLHLTPENTPPPPASAIQGEGSISGEWCCTPTHGMSLKLNLPGLFSGVVWSAIPGGGPASPAETVRPARHEELSPTDVTGLHVHSTAPSPFPTAIATREGTDLPAQPAPGQRRTRPTPALRVDTSLPNAAQLPLRRASNGPKPEAPVRAPDSPRLPESPTTICSLTYSERADEADYLQSLRADIADAETESTAGQAPSVSSISARPQHGYGHENNRPPNFRVYIAGCVADLENAASVRAAVLPRTCMCTRR
ncbi:hypothetical protein BV25DRAFT_713936 [Artomyces pyxidatus]|uniref:Uncharacterized protein n=1 Tax=Artomyces pyxidatus TaxID=48021 RepID=A0ACB8T0C0_9AGAM|nr:hypothetical protein BV25DRAFT_713936 [Artomyces pyxidatus]